MLNKFETWFKSKSELTQNILTVAFICLVLIIAFVIVRPALQFIADHRGMIK